ncbi:MAG: outer membrane beta-barrel protein [Gammaproteobacteria bacterium]
MLLSGNAIAGPAPPREPGDAIRFQLSQTMMRDSNLYRLPDDIEASALSPDAKATRDDVVNRTSASADGGWRFGRQDVEMSVSADSNRYSNNDSLNNTSGSGRADWNWQMASDWSGQLGGSYGRSLSGFTNSRFLARDVLETYDYHSTARYQLTPHWNLNGQARESDGSHDTASRQQDDFESQTAVFGAGYLTGRGDQFGLEYRRTATSFQNETPGPALFESRRYIDRVANFNLQYAFTVKTSLQGSAGYVWRHYPQGVLGDFAGPTWNASFHWEPRSKTRVTITQWRELNAYLDSESSHFQSRGTRLTVAWLPGARETFAFEVSDEHHDYAGFDPASFAQPARRDALRSAQTTFTWQPGARLAIDLAYAFERRSSNRPLFDYDDRLVSATLRLVFLKGRPPMGGQRVQPVAVVQAKRLLLRHYADDPLA